MNYMEGLFQTQKKMYDSFKEMYGDGQDKDKNGESNVMEDFLNMQNKSMEFWKENTKAFMNNGNPYSFYGESGNPFVMYGGHVNPFMFYGNRGQSFNMETMMDMQKEYFKNMNQFFNQAGNKEEGDPYNFKNMNAFFNKYKDSYSNYDFSKILDMNVMEVMDKMYDANKFYLRLYNFWNGLNDEFMAAAKIDYGRMNDFIRENNDMAYSMIIDILPGDYKIFLEGPRDLANKYLDVTSDFYKPWGDSIIELRDLFLEGSLENDVEKITEFFRLWKEKYDQTYGQIVASPVLGVNKNVMEKQNKLFDRFVNLFIVSTGLSNKLMAVQRTAFQTTIERYIELSKEGKQAKSFEEFYEFWSKQMDDHLVDYFGSLEFSKLMGEFSSSIMDFKLASNRLMESYLADTPIVTKGQLDSMIKKTYDLQKEVKSLRKEVDELKTSASKKTK